MGRAVGRKKKKVPSVRRNVATGIKDAQNKTETKKLSLRTASERNETEGGKRGSLLAIFVEGRLRDALSVRGVLTAHTAVSRDGRPSRQRALRRGRAWKG